MPALLTYLPEKRRRLRRTASYQFHHDRSQKIAAHSAGSDRCLATRNNRYVAPLHIKSAPKRWLVAEHGEAAAQEKERLFQHLVQQWQDETGMQSSLSKIISNINYLRIIALGKPAIPFILRELKREPAPWFVALQALTGEENIGQDTNGNFRKMASAWLEWGRAHAYI